ncbi:unnamed protein product [Heligmosomoides polygyrus]|uniref:Uncharacterized protein n=1 Tax=Heligmosomoides polygyrus TaxID=6339 RepID=A0A183FDV3_HELPZ|nr:unnamed protein product [Heligmosomoides polygyrus]
MVSQFRRERSKRVSFARRRYLLLRHPVADATLGPDSDEAREACSFWNGTRLSEQVRRRFPDESEGAFATRAQLGANGRQETSAREKVERSGLCPISLVQSHSVPFPKCIVFLLYTQQRRSL